MLRLLVIFVLATDVPVPQNIPAAPLALFRQECIELELMDRREQYWLFESKNRFKQDIATIRQRYKDLQDAPFSSEGDLYPCDEVIQQLLNFNSQCRQRLASRLYVSWEKEMVQAYTEDMMRRYQVYEAVSQARCTAYGITHRRTALKNLRDEVLGPGEYYRGCLPAIVPIGYIRQTN